MRVQPAAACKLSTVAESCHYTKDTHYAVPCAPHNPFFISFFIYFFTAPFKQNKTHIFFLLPHTLRRPASLQKINKSKIKKPEAKSKAIATGEIPSEMEAASILSH